MTKEELEEIKQFAIDAKDIDDNVRQALIEGKVCPIKIDLHISLDNLLSYKNKQ